MMVDLDKANSLANTFTLKFLQNRLSVVSSRVLEGDDCLDIHEQNIIELMALAAAIAVKTSEHDAWSR